MYDVYKLFEIPLPQFVCYKKTLKGLNTISTEVSMLREMSTFFSTLPSIMKWDSWGCNWDFCSDPVDGTLYIWVFCWKGLHF